MARLKDRVCDECPNELGRSYLMVRQVLPDGRSDWKYLCLDCARIHRFRPFDASYGGRRWVGLRARPTPPAPS